MISITNGRANFGKQFFGGDITVLGDEISTPQNFRQ